LIHGEKMTEKINPDLH